MPHLFVTSVISAVRKADGAEKAVVFLTEADTWTCTLGNAEIIEDEAHADIRLLEAGYQAGDLRDVRLAEVDVSHGGVRRLASDRVCL